jgi:hypothetical protein
MRRKRLAASFSNLRHNPVCALPRRRVRRKPLDPLFIHSGEVCFLKKDDSDTRDPFEGSACGFEDGRDILQALSGLFLDRIPNNLAGYWIVRPRAFRRTQDPLPVPLGCMSAAETERQAFE